MDFEIYCHDLINPPAHDRDCNINLDVTNTTLIQFVKKRATTTAGTRYLLTIPHPGSAGFTSYERYEFNNFILAFNLVLERVCVTSKYSNFSMLSRQDVHVTVTHSARIEERTILEAFRNLQKFKMSEIKSISSLPENNLKKSPQNYSNAMEQEHLVLKFRDLFTALEVCTNMDGDDRRNGPFDNEVSNLSGTDPNTVNRWRLLYNRVKHEDQDQKDINLLHDSEKGLSQQVTALRNVIRGILLSRLK